MGNFNGRTVLVDSGYVQICGVLGTVSWPGYDDGTGEIQLWKNERTNNYIIYAIHRVGEIARLVCELLMLYTLSLPNVH